MDQTTYRFELSSRDLILSIEVCEWLASSPYKRISTAGKAALLHIQQQIKEADENKDD